MADSNRHIIVLAEDRTTALKTENRTIEVLKERVW